MMFNEDEINEIVAQQTKFREKQIEKSLNQKFWPKYFQIFGNTQLGKPITALSPFTIQKALYGQVGTVPSIKKIFRKDKVPYLLVEVANEKQSHNTLKTTQLAEVSVTILEDSKLNESKGVLRTKELDDMEEEDILEELKPQGVTSIHRLVIKRGDQRIATGTYFLTFGKSKIT